VRLHLRDGSTLEREQHDYEGFHTRPMSWDTVTAKFDRLAARHADSGVRRRIVALVRRLDKFDHFGVEELTRLLMTPPDF
jgi:2-methylcitrate dehydratase